MARVKIKFPEEKPVFRCNIPVRISDINYGRHLGNDAVLSILHEARMQLLSSWGYNELNAGGNSLIMGDVMIAYKKEAFYGDILCIEMYVTEVTGHAFDILYMVTCQRENTAIEIAHAKTGMIAFDYDRGKITSITDELKSRLQAMVF